MRSNPTRIAVGVLLLLLAACASAPPATEPPVPTSTPPPPEPTQTPRPEATLIPTYTPSPELPAWPALERGDWGEPEAFAVQRLLRHNGFTVMADGKYGRLTEAAVIQFQNARGLTPNGIVTSKTWTELVKGVVLEEGDSGEAVRLLQYLLVRKLEATISEDGTFGPETAQAVLDLEATVPNLAPDARVDELTWQALIGLKP